MRIAFICLLCFIGLSTVNTQWSCALKYQQCTFYNPCCANINDPMICLQSGYNYYCYSRAEYLAWLSQQTTTTTTTKKPCASIYQRCDFMECCTDPASPKACAQTPSGKFCFDKALVDGSVATTTRSPSTTIAASTTAAASTTTTATTTPTTPATTSTATDATNSTTAPTESTTTTLAP